MPKELWIALITFCGILLSAIMSLLISRNIVNTELKKLRYEMKKTYASKLLEARLNVYPTLYFLLSSFLKEARYKTIHKKTIETLLSQIDEWDSKNAILLGENSGRICYVFRENLWQLLHCTDEELKRNLSSTQFIEELRTEAQKLELAIKSDLGIYGVDLIDGEFGTGMTNDHKRVLDDLQHKYVDRAHEISDVK